jgi:hypothetical protein
MGERHGGRRLEERGFEPLDRAHPAVDEVDDLLLGDRRAANDDAFPEVHQVR